MEYYIAQCVVVGRLKINRKKNTARLVYACASFRVVDKYTIFYIV